MRKTVSLLQPHAIFLTHLQINDFYEKSLFYFPPIIAQCRNLLSFRYFSCGSPFSYVDAVKLGDYTEGNMRLTFLELAYSTEDSFGAEYGLLKFLSFCPDLEVLKVWINGLSHRPKLMQCIQERCSRLTCFGYGRPPVIKDVENGSADIYRAAGYYSPALHMAFDWKPGHVRPKNETSGIRWFYSSSNMLSPPDLSIVEVFHLPTTAQVDFPPRASNSQLKVFSCRSISSTDKLVELFQCNPLLEELIMQSIPDEVNLLDRRILDFCSRPSTLPSLRLLHIEDLEEDHFAKVVDFAKLFKSTLVDFEIPLLNILPAVSTLDFLGQFKSLETLKLLDYDVEMSLAILKQLPALKHITLSCVNAGFSEETLGVLRNMESLIFHHCQTKLPQLVTLTTSPTRLKKLVVIDRYRQVPCPPRIADLCERNSIILEVISEKGPKPRRQLYGN
ncbi:hypothetical protein BX666DRAFT_2023793 [Dichotomocladium elegans]|nr:hypothetical protein BX666DRAFT_2023793 [Dichotomocladium elegans]